MPDPLNNDNIEGNSDNSASNTQGQNQEIDNKDIIDALDLPEITGESKSEEIKNIQDININSINDIFSLLVNNKYDFVTFEPSDSEVKLEFRKDNIILDTKFIKYPIYSNILLKAKGLTKLNLEETNEEQEGIGEFALGEKNLKIISKTTGSNFGEKLFLKATEVERKVEKKEVKKMTLSQILTFLFVTALVGLIVGGSFIGFIVYNAQSVEDVRFFAGLGISLNDINAFIAKLTTVVFSILMLAETIVLIIFLFKFFLTPKEFKKKKVKFGILGALFLITTLSTFAVWMIIDEKIKSLPNWQEMSYGDIQLYDNDKLINENFTKDSALLRDTSSLIGPIDIRFDLTYLAQKEKGMLIESYEWDFGDGNTEQTQEPTLIKNFNTAGIIRPSVRIIGKDIQGKAIEKIVEGIPNISISYVVDIQEKVLNSGGKQVTFDASSLAQLGNIKWYDMEDRKKTIYDKNVFITNPFFKDTIFEMKISGVDTEIIKLFIIKGQNEIAMDGEIEFSRGTTNDLEVTFNVKNVQNDVGLGYIEKYIWKIGSQVITKEGDYINPEKSSEIKHIFSGYGEQSVSVELINSAGESKTLTRTIDLPKILKVPEGMTIYTDGEKIDNVIYSFSLNEYFIDGLNIPTEIEFDARHVKSDSALYTLQDIEWDFDSNGDIDSVGKVGVYSFNAEGNYKVTANIVFVNRKTSSEIIKIKQEIFIEAIRKEAIVNFEIVMDSEYAPIIVGFDGSKSSVRDSNIVKFTWDYGDGIIEERDAVIQGHKYVEAGEYDVKLIVTTQDGKSYSKTKRLILKPIPQSVKISTSMKRAPIGQGIDFISSGSEGQISSYVWDFGDGDISTQANPTHAFSKAGKYKVTLKLEFVNRNILEENVEIEVY